MSQRGNASCGRFARGAVFSFGLYAVTCSWTCGASAWSTPYNTGEELGLHHRRIVTAAGVNAPDGSSTYTHLELGLNYRDNSGNLVEAKPLIEPFPEGAIARQTAIKVIFANDINVQGAVDILTPGEERLQATPIGLSYYDPATGQSVLIAEVKSARGKIVASNRIVYEDFLTDIAADALYEVTRAGIMQVVVIKEALPLPSEYGLSDESARLEVMTEFVASSQPEKRARVLRYETDEQRRQELVEPDFIDETLVVGNALFPSGAAFAFGMEGIGESAVTRRPVGKRWQDYPEQGRSVLFEAVEFQTIREQISLLLSQGNVGKGSAAIERSIPQRRLAAGSKVPMEMAQAGYKAQGFAVDFQVVGALRSMDFEPGQTYFIRDTLHVLDARFGPGCVLKYAPDAKLSINGKVLFEGTDEKPSVFTTCEDDVHGAAIPPVESAPAESGTLLGTRTDRALELLCSPEPVIISHAQIQGAIDGIFLSPTAREYQYEVRDSQFVDCATAIRVGGGGKVGLLNLTLCRVGDACVLEAGGDVLSSEGVVVDCGAESEEGSTQGEQENSGDLAQSASGQAKLDGIRRLEHYRKGIDPSSITGLMVFTPLR